MKSMAESKNSNSFEVVSIDDNHHSHAEGSSSASSPLDPERNTSSSSRHTGQQGCMHLSPRGRLVALACYLLISGLSSLYFCLVQAGMESIELCESVTSCLFYSTQGWPALGEQSIDLLIMSYISGTISVIGGILGAFGIYAAYKESASKVRLFARVWWIMIGIIIGSTVLTLFLTVVHKERFLNQCSVDHDQIMGTTNCGAMYVAALLGSMIGCLIGVTMIWCYGEDVVKYSVELETAKQKTRRIDQF